MLSNTITVVTLHFVVQLVIAIKYIDIVAVVDHDKEASTTATTHKVTETTVVDNNSIYEIKDTDVKEDVNETEKDTVEEDAENDKTDAENGKADAENGKTDKEKDYMEVVIDTKNKNEDTKNISSFYLDNINKIKATKQKTNLFRRIKHHTPLMQNLVLVTKSEAPVNKFVVNTDSASSYSSEDEVSHRRLVLENLVKTKTSYIVAISPTPDIRVVRYNVRIYRLCSGILITKDWVLSSADCVGEKDDNVTDKQVIYGDFTIPPNTTKHVSKVLRQLPHQTFKPHFHVNDIGLLNIEPIRDWHYAFLSAVDYGSLIGFTVRYAGVGSTLHDLQSKRNLKQILENDQVKPIQISEAVVAKCTGHDRKVGHICVREKCKQPFVEQNGDHGGPLIFRNKVIGIACSGYHDDYAFTAISPHLAWIIKAIAVPPSKVNITTTTPKPRKVFI